MTENANREALRILESLPHPPAITREVAESLTLGDILHYGTCRVEVGPRGGRLEYCMRWRVNGRVKTWKRDPDRFEIPVKYGLYDYGTVDQGNGHMFHRAEDCPEGFW